MQGGDEVTHCEWWKHLLLPSHMSPIKWLVVIKDRNICILSSDSLLTDVTAHHNNEIPEEPGTAAQVIVCMCMCKCSSYQLLYSYVNRQNQRYIWWRAFSVSFMMVCMLFWVEEPRIRHSVCHVAGGPLTINCVSQGNNSLSRKCLFCQLDQFPNVLTHGELSLM